MSAPVSVALGVTHVFDDVRFALGLSALGFDAEAERLLRPHSWNPAAALALKTIEAKDASAFAPASPLELRPCF